MTLLRTVRFFFVLRLHPGYALWALAGAVACGLGIMWMSAAELDSALGLLLFVQMFLASTGFVSRARRGHFDQVLLESHAQLRTVVAHWIVSIGPGLVAWGVLVAVAAVAGSAAYPSAVGGSRACAFVIVSLLSWSVGFSLPRGGAGVVWTALLLSALLAHVPIISAPVGAAAARFVPFVAGGAALVCPFILLATSPPVSGIVLAALPIVAAIPLALVWRHAPRLDLTLVESVS